MMLDEQRRKLREKKLRFQRLWGQLSAKWPPRSPGRVVAIQPEQNVYDALCRLKERHGMRSIKEAAYKALVVGIEELKDVPPVPDGPWK